MSSPTELQRRSLSLSQLGPYPEYTSSGVEWLGEIPSHWQIRRLRWTGDLYGGGTPSTSESRYWNGDIPWVSPKDMKSFRVDDTEDHLSLTGLRESTASLIPRDSVLLVVRSGILRRRLPVAISDRAVALNQDMKALVPFDEVDASYLAYWIAAHEGPLLTEWRKEGATVESLETELIKNTWLTLPPPTEQTRISSFLDHQTSTVDDLIAKKRRLIELLEEKRTALITRAVTKGLDPDVPMKNSGVEWLGEIPEHWDTPELRYLSDPGRPIMYGIVLPGPSVEEGVPIIKSGDVSGRTISENGLSKTTVEIDQDHSKSRVKPGDAVYSIRGSFGDVARVPSELSGANLTQDVARISPRKQVDSVWLEYVLRSSSVAAQVHASALGAAVRGVNIRELKRVRVPVPPYPEQRVIARELDSQESRIQRTVNTIHAASEKLIEYRSALITAAVTGKIDVRDHAA